MQLTSPAFSEGADIPEQYTCDGKDVSPPLAWTDVPPGAKSLALICDDPDAPAGDWVHWVLFDVSPALSALPEGVPPQAEIAALGCQGRNDFRKTGYGGPCPPGGTHRYVFTLYAVDRTLGLSADATKQHLVAAMRGHVLAESRLIGKYTRRCQPSRPNTEGSPIASFAAGGAPVSSRGERRRRAVSRAVFRASVTGAGRFRHSEIRGRAS